MYNFNLNCTYNDDTEYQKKLLLSFGLENYDEEQMSKKMDELYDYLSKNEEFSHLFKDVAAMYMSEKSEHGFAFLFSFTFFDKFYDLICEYHNTGNINKETLKSFTAK